MNLKRTSQAVLCRIIFERTPDREKFSAEQCESLLRKEAVDWIYYLLGSSTYIYLVLLAVLFFGQMLEQWPRILLLLDGAQNPYLGALGIYVVLKEVRKRRRRFPSKYFGELFVIFWFLLLAIMTLAIWFSSAYEFNEAYNLVLQNSLVVGLIYLGAFINKP